MRVRYCGRWANKYAVKISCTMPRTLGNVRLTSGALSLGLQEVVRDRGEHHMVMPPAERAAFEVIEAELGLEVLILLLDGPSLVRQTDDLPTSDAVGGKLTK